MTINIITEFEDNFKSNNSMKLAIGNIHRFGNAGLYFRVKN